MLRTLPASLLTASLSLSLAYAQTDPAAPAPQAAGAARPARAARPAPQAAPWPPPPAPLTGPVTYTCGPAKAGELSLVPSAQVFEPSAGFDLKTVPAIANGAAERIGLIGHQRVG